MVPALSTDAVSRDLAAVRDRTLTLVSHLGAADLERVVDPVMSPLVWDLAHIAAFEDLWLCRRHGGLGLLRPDLASMYDAAQTPRAVRGDLSLLDAAGSFDYLAQVRDRALGVLDALGPGDGTTVELVLRHELQHTETMRQAMALGAMLPDGEPVFDPAAGDGTGEVIAVPGGEVEIGAGPDGFAYDNERPRHRCELEPFAIGRRPVGNAVWEAVTGEHRPGAPGAVVCHVSWHEASDFARRVGARLPTELEWEHAAALGLLDGVGQVWEWTSSPFTGYPGFRAHPYREYSEVFFGDGYRVLRGGSWATDARIATTTFRNWDRPQRTNIFAGVRLAWDVAP